jgi:hypothetical protein
MFRTAKSPVKMAIHRSGGSIIHVRVDVWRAAAEDWEAVEQYEFVEATESTENIKKTIPKGTYTCVARCYVEESLNGVYDMKFSVDGTETFAASGDVNTTSAPNDSRVFRNQFVLEVT